MTKITSYLKPHYGMMALGLTIKFIGTIMDLLIPWFLSHIIDDVVPLGDMGQIFLWGGAMLVCSGLALVTNINANRMASRVARSTTRSIRHDLFKKISYLSCAQVDNFSVSSLESRLTSDTYNVHHVVGMTQRIGVRAPILLIGGILITLTLDPVLTLVLLAILPFITIVVYLVSKKGIPLYQGLQKTVDKLISVVRENITGIRIIKAMSKTPYEKKRFEGINNEVVKTDKKASMTMAITNPMMNLLLNTGLTLVVLVGAFRVNSGLTQPGKIIAFMTYFTIILNAMLSITRVFVVFSKGSASYKRIAEVLNAPNDLEVIPEDYVESPYHLTFENVSFSYHKNQDNLTNVSFSLRQGQSLGIIGATGSGKSSIVKLAMRFYDSDSGIIRIGGHNIRSIPLDELHRKFGIVFQDDVIFADTIAENIRLGRDIADEDVFSSSKNAQAGEFIDSLTDNYEHELSIRGSNLSGGQRQRVLISRALAGDPEILILDDSSSALDYKTDAQLRKAISSNYNDTTTIIVAQRISSIAHCNRILMLDEGKTIGYGTHEELLRDCPEYCEINDIQMGGAK